MHRLVERTDDRYTRIFALTDYQSRIESIQLLAKGEFSKLREAIGQSGNPEEAWWAFNYIQILHTEYRHRAISGIFPRSDEMNNFARIFFKSQYGSAEFYATLFAILRKCGFDAKDRPVLKNMVNANLNRPYSFADRPEDRERMAKYEVNLALAFDSAFPKE